MHRRLEVIWLVNLLSHVMIFMTCRAKHFYCMRAKKVVFSWEKINPLKLYIDTSYLKLKLVNWPLQHNLYLSRHQTIATFHREMNVFVDFLESAVAMVGFIDVFTIKGRGTWTGLRLFPNISAQKTTRVYCFATRSTILCKPKPKRRTTVANCSTVT